MTEYKALFLDVDGTIVRPDDTIEPSTKKAIEAIGKQGLEVILTTGRPLHEIEELAKQLKINSYIGYNGASAIINGHSIFKIPINEARVEKILQIARDYHHEVALHTSTVNYLTHLESTATKQFLTKFNYRKNEALFSTYPKMDVLGMTVINLKKEEAYLYDGVQGLVLSQANVEGMHHCFDVIRDNVNKGTGVSMLLKHLGIPKESAIAFGDGLNDKEMLMNVGESFAMGNAHPDLFAYAKYKTTDVMDSGIYHGLRMIGLVDLV